MWIRTAALVALVVLYLCWTDEILAAKRSGKRKGHGRPATLSHRHSTKNGQNKISKQYYWRQIGDLNKRLRKETKKKGKNGISRKWKKKWRKAKKNLDRQYRDSFGKVPSKKEKKKYGKKDNGKSGDKRKKIGNGSKKRVEIGTEYDVRKVSEESGLSEKKGIVQSEVGGGSGGPEVSHPSRSTSNHTSPPSHTSLSTHFDNPSTPSSNHTPPSTHHSNHHQNATHQDIPNQTKGDNAGQNSTGQKQQSNEPKKDPKKRSQYDDPTHPSDEEWQKMGINDQFDYLAEHLGPED